MEKNQETCKNCGHPLGKHYIYGDKGCSICPPNKCKKFVPKKEVGNFEMNFPNLEKKYGERTDEINRQDLTLIKEITSFKHQNRKRKKEQGGK